MKLPSLTELQKFIVKKNFSGAWNHWGKTGMSKTAKFFSGNCHHASKALAALLDISTTHHMVRGWYTYTQALEGDRSWIRNSMGHIGHTWLEIDGKIIDPTWWAFHPGERAKIYTFSHLNPNYYNYHTVDPR